MTIDELDLHGNSEAVCPYCGYEEPDSWELQPDQGTTECGRCEKEFRYHREAVYSTSKITE